MAATGRPTKYSQAMLDKADYYITKGYIEEGDVFPMAEGLACSLGVVQSTLYKWAETHEAFSETLGKLKQKQARVTLNKSLTGEINPTISKLVLHNHGYSDRVQQDQVSSDRSMSPPAKIELVARDITHGYDE